MKWLDDASHEVRVAWDAHIRATRITDALGHTKSYYYDALGYTYRIVHADEREEWFWRDEARNITRHLRPDGGVERFEYDEQDHS